MCNDVLNNCVIINGMNKPCHESLIRLYEAAIESKKIDSETPTDLAKSPPFPCQIPAISHLNHCFYKAKKTNPDTQKNKHSSHSLH